MPENRVPLELCMGLEAQADEFAAIENVRRVIRHGSMLLAIAGRRVKLLGRHGWPGRPPASECGSLVRDRGPPAAHPDDYGLGGASSFSETAQTPLE